MRAEQGQALVEFALVLPILMLLVLGIIKGGILYNNYLTVTDAVRSGARQLAVERGQTAPCDDAAAEVIRSAAGLSSGNIAITITELPDPDVSPRTYTYSNSTGSGASTCPTLQSGGAVTLQASYPCDFSIPLFGTAIIPSCRINVSATERVE
jgi:Flp pilus assembly protein TadG